MADAPVILAYSSDDELLRDAVRPVVERELTTARVRAHMDDDLGWDERDWDLITDLGWPGVAVPEAHGGAGLGLAGLGILAEELGRGIDATPLLWHAAAAHLLATLAGDDVGAERLAAIVGGEAIATISLDPEHSLGEIVVTTDGAARRAGGRRLLVPHGRSAALVLLDATADGRPALALVDLVDGRASSEPATSIDIARAHATVDLAGAPCVIVATDEAELDWVRSVAVVVQCAESVGVARALLESTVAYASQRRQFGQPIGSFQAIKHRLADMRIKLAAAVVATRYASWATARRAPDHVQAAAVAGYWVGTATSWLASEALQVFGGIGFTWEHDLHLSLRRLKANELLFGSPRHHRLVLGARALAPAT